MPPQRSQDLGVDVLIVGAGLQAAYLANSLHPRFSVLVVDDPGLPSDDLDGDGRFGAGYDGNDVARIQPARRAAAFWSHWARDQDLTDSRRRHVRLPAPRAVADRTSAWTAATLPFADCDPLPEVFEGGTARNARAFETPGDVVLDPGTVIDRLRASSAPRWVRAEVVAFSLFADDVIELVELDVAGKPVPVVARVVVVAAESGNAEVLRRLAARVRDPVRRREVTRGVRSCQAVLSQQVVAIRGDLPLLAGTIDDLSYTSHADGDEVVWLVSPPPNPALTTLGPVDARFPVPVDSDEVAEVVEQVLAVSPMLFRHAHRLSWTAWGRRIAQHPMAAGTGEIGAPVPARLDSFGFQGVLALWPSHPAFTMVLGDVAAERIAAELGTPADFSRSLEPEDLAHSPSSAPVSRWRRPVGGWSSWESFAEAHDIKLA